VIAAKAPEHHCWSWDDPAEFQTPARAFLRAGLAGGEQVWFVAGARTAVPAGWLPEATARPGSARFIAVDDAYPAGHVVDPDAQVAAYAAATGDALAAGFTGLRVAADVTSLVRTTAQRQAFARYEFTINRFMLTSPMRAACGYDRTILGETAIAELACLHPRTNAEVPFRLLSAPAGDERVLLDGELDAATETVFAAALRSTDRSGEFVVEGDGLRFVDHRSLLQLQRHAEQRGSTTVLRTRLTSARRLADLLDLSRVRVEVTR
jgi:anti-anti-sigma regulatory factor